MNRVGIITFHASHNYGSVLQAYAISTKLKDLGYQPEIINLRNKAQLEAYKVFKTKGSGVKKIAHTLYAILNYNKSKKRAAEFERFINKVLPITNKCFSNGDELKDNTNYDIYICGSDQIWNPACQDFESAYYLDFVTNGAKKIAYAPSLGKVNFSDEHLTLIGDLVNNIDYISCREKDGAELLRSLTDKPVTEVCDPVVLLGSDKWKEFAKEPKIKGQYILTYFLENNHGTKGYLKELQQKTGYRVICLNEDIKDIGKGYKHIINASPEEFVGLFKNAALVYTNSFHGTAFATMFNRPLVTIIGEENERNNNDSRKINYLNTIGLSHRIVKDKLPNIEEVLSVEDYKLANEKIETIRSNSNYYLTNALNS